MRRIGLAVVLMVGLTLAPFSADGAQQANRMATVVLVWDDLSGLVLPNSREALVQGLRDLGWVEGTNVTTDERHRTGRIGGTGSGTTP